MLPTELVKNSLKFPFPYFYVDKNNRILSYSKISKMLFPTTDNFLELINNDQRQDFKNFLVAKDEFDFLNTSLICKKKIMQNFSIFKISDPQSEKTHLYCLNLDNLLSQNPYFDRTNFDSKDFLKIMHEIRNPLTTVKGLLQILIPTLEALGKSHYAEVALSELDRATDIACSYLRKERNELKEYYLTNLEDFLAKLNDTYIAKCFQKKILFINNSNNYEDVSLNINENMLNQIFSNLIMNSVEAIEDKRERDSNFIGLIMLDIELEAESINFYIRDNGSGIDDLTLKKLYTPLYTTKSTGTGIGLVVCRDIIEKNSGKITVESQLNKGTLFKLKLDRF